ncbi:hypothetical protein HK17_02665 [Acetobacter indonesiensis]|uniref:Uncharacterized protein n=1 Tax=Acetobacter indonesiensis TaxID=104101 RepID=A0A252AWF0_9PROT|nr:hypothetical protein HK17_02665 [Acetobacter indonesiensis]
MYKANFNIEDVSAFFRQKNVLWASPKAPIMMETANAEICSRCTPTRSHCTSSQDTDAYDESMVVAPV